MEYKDPIDPIERDMCLKGMPTVLWEIVLMSGKDVIKKLHKRKCTMFIETKPTRNTLSIQALIGTQLSVGLSVDTHVVRRWLCSITQ